MVTEVASGHLLAGLAVDRHAPTPAYLQLRSNIERLIRDGSLSVDAAMPSERELAESLGVSRMTLRRAVDMLVKDGLLDRRHGSGTYVRKPPVEQVMDAVQSFSKESRALGFKPGTRLLEVRETRPDPGVAALLGLEAHEETTSITRLRTADDEPLAIQRAYLPRRYQGLSIDFLRELESLYATLERQFGVRILRARQSVTARLPSVLERRWLSLGANDPVLALERISFDQEGRVAEVVQSAYHGGRYRMILELGSSDSTFAGESP